MNFKAGIVSLIIPIFVVLGFGLPIIDPKPGLSLLGNFMAGVAAGILSTISFWVVYPPLDSVLETNEDKIRRIVKEEMSKK